MREGLKIKSIRISSFLLPYLLTGWFCKTGTISAPQNKGGRHENHQPPNRSSCDTEHPRRPGKAVQNH